jgi:hypothetical protein
MPASIVMLLPLLHRKHGHPVLLPTNGACIEVVWDQGIGEIGCRDRKLVLQVCSTSTSVFILNSTIVSLEAFTYCNGGVINFPAHPTIKIGLKVEITEMREIFLNLCQCDHPGKGC